MESWCLWMKVGLLILIGLFGIVYLLVSRETYRRFRIPALVFLALAAMTAFGTYIRFGDFLHGHKLHHHDVAHYYFGSKYAPEFGYHNIYRCICIADNELLQDAGKDMPAAMRRFKIRHLEDYELWPLEDIVQSREEIRLCKSRFTDERWKQFKQDVSDYYRVQDHDNLYDRCGDRGYHGTPVWSLYAGGLANLLPVENGWLIAASWLDLLILGLGFLMIGRAYGAELGLLTLILYFATAFNQQHYIHFSYLRYDWMGVTLMALAWLKMGRYKLSGAAFGFAALIRLFPVLLMFGLGVKIIWDLAAKRRIERKYLRFAAGYTVVVVVGLALSLLVYGADFHRDYVEKLKLHSGITTQSRVGLIYMMNLYKGKTLHSATAGLFGDEAAKTLEKNVNVKKQRKIIRWILAFGTLLLLGIGARKLEDDEATALGYALTFLFLGMTVYYGVVIAILVPLFLSRERRFSNAALWAGFIAAMLGMYVLIQADVSRNDINNENSLLIFLMLTLAAFVLALRNTRVERRVLSLGQILYDAARKRPRLSLAAAIVVISGLFTFLILHWSLDTTPRRTDWERALLEVKERGFNKNSDAVVVVLSPTDDNRPRNTDITVFQMEHPETHGFWRYRRVWILAEPGRADKGSLSPRRYHVGQASVSKDSPWQQAVQIQRIDFTEPLERRMNLLDNIGRAEVWMETGGGDHLCIRENSRRFDCANNEWNFVGPEGKTFNDTWRKAIWAHPAAKALVIRFADVELGERLSLETGLTDSAAELRDGASVWVDILINGKRVAVIEQKNVPGWHLHGVNTQPFSGQRIALQFRIHSTNPGRRHFLFDGDILVKPSR